MLRRYHGLAERTGPFGAVALTPDQSQWDALANAGFSHALTLPVSEDALRETVLEILGSHDDVADLGAPLPETRQADAPLPDLFGPVAAPQADQGMPDLLLSTDDMPERTVPAAQAATGGDLPDLFAAPASAGAEAAPAAPLSLTDDMRRDAPVAPVAQTARPEAEQPLPADDEQSGAVRAEAAEASAADDAQPVAPAPADSPCAGKRRRSRSGRRRRPGPRAHGTGLPSVPVAAMDDAATQEAPLEEEKKKLQRPKRRRKRPCRSRERRMLPPLRPMAPLPPLTQRTARRKPLRKQGPTLTCRAPRRTKPPRCLRALRPSRPRPRRLRPNSPCPLTTDRTAMCVPMLPKHRRPMMRSRWRLRPRTALCRKTAPLPKRPKTTARPRSHGTGLPVRAGGGNG